MCVIDHTQDRTLCAQLGQEIEQTQSDKERVRSLAVTTAEHDFHCAPLGLGELFNGAGGGTEEFLQAGVRKLHLRFVSDGPQYSKLVR